MIPVIMRAIAGAVASKGRGKVAAAKSAVSSAKSGGNAAAVARAEQRLDRASRAADRNDMMMGQVTDVVQKAEEFTGGLIGVNRYTHSITVSVRGGPSANLRRCWFLCIAALFGRRRRGVSSNFAEALNAQWDITGKSVTATLTYTNNPLTEADQHLTSGFSPAAVLQRGPDQVTIGAGWTGNFFTYKQQPINPFEGALSNLVGIGGVFRPGNNRLPVSLRLPGDLDSPSKVNEMNGVSVPYTLPPVEPAKQQGGLFYGWRISKITTDNDPNLIRNVFTTPWVVQQAEPDPLAELPISAPGASRELVPYTVHAPLVIQGGGVNGNDLILNSVRYVRRGDGQGLVPVLPDEGRIITTGEKHNSYIQPPKPPVDGVSRGSLLSMVAAALASPGVLVESPANYTNNTQPVAAEGVFVFRPGTQFSNQTDEKYRFHPNAVASRASNTINGFINQVVRGMFAPFAVPNIRPAKGNEVELRGGVDNAMNPQLRG